jgi:hypothetical protein
MRLVPREKSAAQAFAVSLTPLPTAANAATPVQIIRYAAMGMDAGTFNAIQNIVEVAK